jgi:hypothetical protein
MRIEQFDRIMSEIQTILENGSQPDWNLNHAKKVLEITLRLKPNASKELKIAAFGHDIERSITGETDSKLKSMANYENYKKNHAKRCSKIIGDILLKHKINAASIDKIKRIVLYHEVGGSPLINLLKDADALAFFEYDVKQYMKFNNWERTKDKLLFTINRLSPSAKKIVSKIKFSNKKVKEFVLSQI